MTLLSSPMSISRNSYVAAYLQDSTSSNNEIIDAIAEERREPETARVLQSGMERKKPSRKKDS